MDFEFKLLVKRNKFGLELLSKTELIENSGASLRRPLISVLCKVEIPSLIHLLQELCIIHFMNMCVLQNVEGNCRLLQFLLFSCIYVLIPFLNQTVMRSHPQVPFHRVWLLFFFHAHLKHASTHSRENAVL